MYNLSAHPALWRGDLNGDLNIELKDSSWAGSAGDINFAIMFHDNNELEFNFFKYETKNEAEHDFEIMMNRVEEEWEYTGKYSIDKNNDIIIVLNKKLTEPYIDYFNNKKEFIVKVVDEYLEI